MASNPLTDLETELTAAAWRQAIDIPAVVARRRPRRRRLALVLAALLLVVAAGTFAAVRLLATGKPVPYLLGRPATAHSGYGVPVAGTVHMLGPIADPAGGIPWAARIFHTTRGYGCMQVGRLYRGKLGILGRDHEFGNDGRFHELRPGVLSQYGTCVPLDGADHPHLAVHIDRYAVSGGVCFPRSCPVADLRSIDSGFAGPDARSISYRPTHGATREVTTGPEGAYLLVLPHQPERPLRDRGGYFPSDRYLFTETAASRVLVRVDYTDGTTCRVRPTPSTAGGCPGHGPVAVHLPLPSRAAVRTPLHLRVTGHGSHALLHARFRARVAAIGDRAAYDLLIKPERRRPVHPRPTEITATVSRCTIFETTALEHDVERGTMARKDVSLHDFQCNGWYDVSLYYRVQSGRVGLRGAESFYPGRFVSRARVFVPR